MTESVILTTPIIVIISVIALIMSVAGRFVGNKIIRAGLYIASFLCAVGCITYALLLGVELDELLTYILLFMLLGLTAFIPTAQHEMPLSAPQEEQTETEVTEENDEL